MIYTVTSFNDDDGQKNAHQTPNGIRQGGGADLRHIRTTFFSVNFDGPVRALGQVLGMNDEIEATGIVGRLLRFFMVMRMLICGNGSIYNAVIQMTEESTEQKSQPPTILTSSWDSQRKHILERLETKLDKFEEKTATELKEIRQSIAKTDVNLAEIKEGQKWVKWLLVAIVVPTWMAIFGALLGGALKLWGAI